MANTANFGFIDGFGANLAALAALAESYFRTDPSTALFKLRQFAELLAKKVAARHGLYQPERRDNFETILTRLSYERVLPRETADLFHGLRKLGNYTAHETKATHFAAFETAYSADPNGEAERGDRGNSGCFRRFTRERVAERNDDLDIAWLRNTEAEAEEELTGSDDIAAEIVGHCAGYSRACANSAHSSIKCCGSNTSGCSNPSKRERALEVAHGCLLQ